MTELSSACSFVDRADAMFAVFAHSVAHRLRRSLDVSHNELAELPGLESLVSLTELDLCRACAHRQMPSALPWSNPCHNTAVASH